MIYSRYFELPINISASRDSLRRYTFFLSLIYAAIIHSPHFRLFPLVVGCPGTPAFQLYAKVSFSVGYQFEGKGLENNFGPSVELS